MRKLLLEKDAAVLRFCFLSHLEWAFARLRTVLPHGTEPGAGQGGGWSPAAPRLCIPQATCTYPGWTVSYSTAKSLQQCSIGQYFSSLDTLPYLAFAVHQLPLRVGREMSNNLVCRRGICLLPLRGHVKAEACGSQIKLFLMQSIL